MLHSNRAPSSSSPKSVERKAAHWNKMSHHATSTSPVSWIGDDAENWESAWPASDLLPSRIAKDRKNRENHRSSSGHRANTSEKSSIDKITEAPSSTDIPTAPVQHTPLHSTQHIPLPPRSQIQIRHRSHTLRTRYRPVCQVSNLTTKTNNSFSLAINVVHGICYPSP